MDVDASLNHVFFPYAGVISVVAVYADGNVIEMATIAREGFAGVQAFSLVRQAFGINSGQRGDDAARHVRSRDEVDFIRSPNYWVCSGRVLRTQSRSWRTPV
ncbi:MAG: hypothetical protein WCD69_26800 [Xanthobacteraceae bacterium]